MIALDFETEGIQNRPEYPPKPVGLAICKEGFPGNYFAWGHPTQNNCKYEDIKLVLEKLLQDEQNEFVFHNAPFDCAIIEERMGLVVPWGRVHDTMLLAFLTDPFGELSLKPLSEKLLGMPPDEQEAVRDWLIKHGVCRSNDKSWGAWISKAPGDLVGAYAIGDVERTLKLYNHFMGELV